MATQTKAKSSTSKVNAANVLAIKEEPGKRHERKLAELGFSPLFANADTARTFAKGVVGEIAIGDALDTMIERTKRVQNGDLAEVEATLTAQAIALDAIFNALAKRAALNMGGLPPYPRTHPLSAF